ncbi:hypothetical protein [Phenylobacterium sp.]|uniref:hypothetical protein n=1 Tax=Phenylobacterium sp. TaxID=1871053 RepID=UPI0035B4996B
MKRPAALALAAWALAGPALAGDLPSADGWVRTDLMAAGRVLASAAPARRAPGEVLTVVIEGDGMAHDRRGRARADPTPRRATGLEIARAWPDEPKAWLGRLCQYTAAKDAACSPADWTTGRFSEAAVAAADAAIDQLKADAGARRVRLVGWSGGGTLAALAAARRDDVAALVTIAAPLDLAAWTAWHGLSPLAGSLDPVRLEPLTGMAQTHLFGRFDPVVPPQMGEPAARRLAGPGGRVEVWPERHGCCWAGRARAIAGLARSAGGASASEAADQPATAP